MGSPAHYYNQEIEEENVLQLADELQNFVNEQEEMYEPELLVDQPEFLDPELHLYLQLSTPLRAEIHLHGRLLIMIKLLEITIFSIWLTNYRPWLMNKKKLSTNLV